MKPVSRGQSRILAYYGLAAVTHTQCKGDWVTHARHIRFISRVFRDQWGPWPTAGFGDSRGSHLTIARKHFAGGGGVGVRLPGGVAGAILQRR
jgi:hypothetical protein